MAHKRKRFPCRAQLSTPSAAQVMSTIRTDVFRLRREFIFLSPMRRWISKPRARPGPYEKGLGRDASAAFERVAVLHENRVGNAAADCDRVDRGVFGEAAQDGELRDECIAAG